MSVSECPELEELPLFAGLTCLKMIVIDSCEKVPKIMLPTKLIKLTVRRCRGLQTVEVIGNLTKLKGLCISECPELEDLPIFAGLSCLKMLVIDYCKKLQNIILPTTLFKLTVSRYRGSQLLAAISNLTKLEELSIFECPELEELPGFANLSRLKMIAINSCEKLHNIMLPTTLNKLTLQRGKALQQAAGIDHLIKLEFLDLSECPKVELPCLARLSCLKNVNMDSCEKLENLIGIEELQTLEALQLQYCSNAAIQDCIPKLKRVPSAFIQSVGRAADGVKSNLNHSLLSETYLCHSDIWHSTTAIIICGIVVVRSSDPLHTINESLKDCVWKFDLRPGEWIITTTITHQNYRRLYWQFYILSEQGVMKKWCAWAVKKGEDWRNRRALITIIDKLHQK